MFTGIIETVGTIVDIWSQGGNKTFAIQSDISHDLHIDQSISHEGVCLTVEKVNDKLHEVTLIKETLDRSNLGCREIGDTINLERCIKLSDRLDGHMVQGHVDTTIHCIKKIDQQGSWDFHFSLSPSDMPLVVMKGSICINGISLTISSLDENSLGVSIIPFTLLHTTMSDVNVGDHVNVEFDILGKYVQRQLKNYE